MLPTHGCETEVKSFGMYEVEIVEGHIHNNREAGEKILFFQLISELMSVVIM